MIEKNYYSLRICGSNAFHAKDDVLKTTNKTLNIGETSDCEIRLECGQYEPERYATIVENDDGKSWRLIQRSEHVKTQIAGCGGFGYVHQLKDGDVISFDGQDMELEFHTHFDGNYGRAGIVIEPHTDRRLTYGLVAALAATIVIIATLFFNNRHHEINYQDLEEFLSSVYILKVDSVQWIEESDGIRLKRPTMTMESGGAVGTAFLTTDSLLITARHCIEYWIGEEVDLLTKTDELEDNNIKKWAILSEKFMQERENTDTVQYLRVFFSIYSPDMPDEPLFSFCSTDSCVHINRYHDGILEFGDFSGVYYWRTVRPVYCDYDRELGDIVYIKMDQRGKIELADSMTIAQLNQSSSIAVLGFPNNSSGRKNTYRPGTITENRNDTLIGVSPDIQFDANITHGFSGGPVFVRRADGKIVAAGLVSKIDTDNGVFKKAVPVSEIGEMIKRGKEGEQ